MKRIGITILCWVLYSFILIGLLTGRKAKLKMRDWSKRDKQLTFRNARILALLLAIATGLLI